MRPPRGTQCIHPLHLFERISLLPQVAEQAVEYVLAIDTQPGVVGVWLAIAGFPGQAAGAAQLLEKGLEG